MTTTTATTAATDDAQRPSDAALPGPDARPNADVVIYDGHCRFCTSQVTRIAGWDSQGQLAFLSLHDPQVSQRYPDLQHEDLMKDMYIVDRQGRRHRGASALRYLSLKLPQLWAIAPMLHLPWSLPAWQYLYRMFAKRRYRFGRIESCENGSCQIHR